MKVENVFTAFIALIIYLIIGVYGTNSVDYIEADRAMWVSFRWFFVPALLAGLYFGYLSIRTATKKYSSLRKIIAFTAATLGYGFLILFGSHGYMILYNCHIGKQTRTIVKGTIIDIYIPQRKKILSHYSLEIKKKDEEEIIKLVVPTSNYVIGVPFEKEMMVGSLGFIYKDL